MKDSTHWQCLNISLLSAEETHDQQALAPVDAGAAHVLTRMTVLGSGSIHDA